MRIYKKKFNNFKKTMKQITIKISGNCDVFSNVAYMMFNFNKEKIWRRML